MPLRHRARLARPPRIATRTAGKGQLARRTDGRTFVRGSALMALIFWATAGAGARRARADEGRIPDDQMNLRAELGLELDDNVHRAEKIRGARSPNIVSSALSRGVLAWSSSGRVATNQEVSVSLLGAAKGFFEPAARNENVVVVESALAWRAALAGRYQLSAAGSYYEAIQAGTPAERELSGEARDFRSLTPALRAGRFVGGGGLVELVGGYRWFVYKPTRSYDFEGPVAALDYRVARESADGGSDWELATGVGAEFRRFAGPRLVPSPVGCVPADCTPATDPGDSRHVDQFASGHLDLTRTGQVLLGAGYTLQWNRSNSYTESLYRHIATLRLATALPWQFYLAARAEFVFVRYPDHVVLATGPTGSASTSIDDENRNQLRVELSRALTKDGLRIIARYSLYTNALGQSTVQYGRQTATLSLTWTTISFGG